MKKNGQKLKERRELVKTAIHSPEKAAEELLVKISKLKTSRNITDTVRILGEIFYLSEDTIFNDYGS